MGMGNVQSAFLAFKRLSVTGLIFEPSGATATPPNSPVLPPNTAPRLAGVRTSGMGGRLRELTLVASEAPLTSLVAWEEIKKNTRVLPRGVGAPKCPTVIDRR